MKASNLMLGLSLLIAMPSFAQDEMVPATSDDIAEFDDKVVEEPAPVADAPATDTKERKQNFGATVSAEAKRLKELPKDERGKMGEWVSSQRRKNGDKKVRVGSDGSAVGDSSTMGGSADARTSAPGQAKKDQQRSGSDRRSNRGR